MLERNGLCDVKVPNDLWCTDYKGEFMLADRGRTRAGRNPNSGNSPDL